MSLSFTQSQTLLDTNVKSNSVSYPATEKLLDLNLGIDKALNIIFKAGGKWQFDDSNHTDYPIITTDLVANQRDYSFTTDEDGNVILDIYKVLVADEEGVYREILPVDVQSETNTSGFYDGLDTKGIPNKYDKTGNGIFLDPIPDYNKAGGIKIYINREASYFSISDTTKKCGISGLFQVYPVIYASYQYALRNGLPSKNDFEKEMIKMEREISDWYGGRGKDDKRIIRPKYRSVE